MNRCPTCNSPSPNRHPATAWEGEVQPCPDPWHPPIVEAAPSTGDEALRAALDPERLARAMRRTNAAAIPDTSEWRDNLRKQAATLIEEYVADGPWAREYAKPSGGES